MEELANPQYIESLMLRLGFNTEILNEQPAIVTGHGGGLRIWQYPNQFSKYLLLLKDKGIKSYIEIGCRWGGTFVLTCEYLSRFTPVEKAVAVDIFDSPVSEYCKTRAGYSFMNMNSQSKEFKQKMTDARYDLVFIDGDHTYEGVKNDYEVMREKGNIYVFHDIVNAACPGVVRFWSELRKNESATYDFYEFTDQYDDVLRRMNGRRYLGIGVAVRKMTAA